MQGGAALQLIPEIYLLENLFLRRGKTVTRTFEMGTSLYQISACLSKRKQSTIFTTVALDPTVFRAMTLRR
jgi:hypothetical protein